MPCLAADKKVADAVRPMDCSIILLITIQLWAGKLKH